jgi:hypothetical protein
LTTATAEPSNTSGNKPSHIAYVTKPGTEKPFWTAIGAAWAHKDGKGLRIRLDAIPVNGVIELRINEPKAANDTDKIDWSDFSDCEAK